MPRTEALRRKADFERTLRDGRRSSGGGISVAALSRGDAGAPRLGLAVRARGAVARNRIKRRIRAAVVESGVRGVDLVIRADAAAAGKDYQEMVSAISEATVKARS